MPDGPLPPLSSQNALAQQRLHHAIQLSSALRIGEDDRPQRLLVFSVPSGMKPLAGRTAAVFRERPGPFGQVNSRESTSPVNNDCASNWRSASETLLWRLCQPP